MEECKKKRWRPSLTAYRQLEKENEELRKSKFGKNNKVLRDHIEALESENSTLKRSNELMEKELKRVREQVKGATVDYQKARREVLWLRGRSLWDRIINKVVYED